MKEYAEMGQNGHECDRFRRLADRLREIPRIIEADGGESREEFCQLLFHKKDSVRLWAAHHILEVMNCGPAVRKTALKEIKYCIQHDEDRLHALGNKLWLENWYKSHPEDRKL